MHQCSHIPATAPCQCVFGQHGLCENPFVIRDLYEQDSVYGVILFRNWDMGSAMMEDVGGLLCRVVFCL